MEYTLVSTAEHLSDPTPPDTGPPRGGVSPTTQEVGDLAKQCEAALALPFAMNILESGGTRVDRSAAPTVLRLWKHATVIQERFNWRCPAPPERPARPEEFGQAVAALREWARSIGEGHDTKWQSATRHAENKVPDVSPSVDEEDLSILRALAERPNYRLNQDQIEARTKPRVSRRTISSRMPHLLSDGLVALPRGKKGGYTITPRGLDLLKATTPSAR